MKENFDSENKVDRDVNLTLRQQDELCWIVDELYTINQALMHGDAMIMGHYQKISGALHRVIGRIEVII